MPRKDVLVDLRTPVHPVEPRQPDRGGRGGYFFLFPPGLDPAVRIPSGYNEGTAALGTIQELLWISS